MPDKPVRKRPTDFELSILQILWDRKEATVREVHEEIGKTRQAGYTTVLKIMQIMAEKGLVERTEQGKAHIYRPAESAEVSRDSLVDDLIDRAFAGSASQLVMHALSSKAASPEELAEIRRLLDQMEASHE